MKKLFLFLGISIILLAYFYPKSTTDHLRIGIVLPMQHLALDDIVSGFKSELQKLFGEKPIKIELQNAMGDINLQKSAINKFINDKVDLLVPVATSTAQMAINMAPPDLPILFLAANISNNSPEAQKKPGLMGIIDEIPLTLTIKLINLSLPKVKKIAIIYSASDKVFDDVENFINLSQANLSVQKLMVYNLSELYTVAKRIDSDVQAIFILKDNMIASGIATLVQQANMLKIPLISSDEGTNKLGGAFALGVAEADIGRQGAHLADLYLREQNIKTPIQFLDKVKVFINLSACALLELNPDSIEQAAKTLSLETIKR